MTQKKPPMMEWMLALRRMFELEHGEKPRYVTMNWCNYNKWIAENPTLEKLPTEILGCSVFINPCISNEMVHFTFERMN